MNIAATGGAPSQTQIQSLINRRLNAADPNGQPNLFQQVAKLDLSPQAKQAIDTTMAQQLISLRQSQHGQPLSEGQRHSVFNGQVARAIKAYSAHQGSYNNITTQLAARGERIGQVEAGNSATTTSATTTSATTAPVSHDGDGDGH